MTQQASAIGDPRTDATQSRDGFDAELRALAGPPSKDKFISVFVMALTMLVSATMCWALSFEVAYALQPSSPVDVGDLTSLRPTAQLSNRYVRATCLLSARGAVRYERPFEGDSFRLHAVAGNPRVWVEIRVPEGMEGERFVPPVSVVGRLVPIASAGIRHRGLSEAVKVYGSSKMPSNAWILVDGASPRASRWAVALAGVFGVFALWNLIQLIRVLRPIRTRAK